jgi:hypothetical protein
MQGKYTRAAAGMAARTERGPSATAEPNMICAQLEAEIPGRDESPETRPKYRDVHDEE